MENERRVPNSAGMLPRLNRSGGFLGHRRVSKRFFANVMLSAGITRRAMSGQRKMRGAAVGSGR